MSKLDNLKREFDKGMPVITYIKKKFDFDNISDFEEYIVEIQEKAKKYDEIIEKNRLF